MENDIKEREFNELWDRLWPINRSILGPGFRESLDIISEHISFKRLRFPSGSKAFDWTVPNEWDVRDAYFIDPKGKKHADFKKNNLHLMSYSIPVNRTISLAELLAHLHTIKEKPDAIPYVTSYYKEDWAFCIPYNEYRELPEGTYQVVIESQLYPGFLEIGEAVLPGELDSEVLFSTYLCHPSLANNELSGPMAMIYVYKLVKTQPHRRYTYRFVIGPETIGSICYLSLRGQHFREKLTAGFHMTCLGDAGNFTYKTSRRENALPDRVVKAILRDFGPHLIVPFEPSDGSDDRQYCSPGFNLPFGSLMRTMYGQYPEYHTSFDTRSIVTFENIMESVTVYFHVFQALEQNRVWKNTIQFCEPQLGRRGLYPNTSKDQLNDRIESLMWLLNLSDGTSDLIDIALRSGKKLSVLAETALTLKAAGLLEEV